jgi:hypothetical protein
MAPGSQAWVRGMLCVEGTQVFIYFFIFLSCLPPFIPFYIHFFIPFYSRFFLYKTNLFILSQVLWRGREGETQAFALSAAAVLVPVDRGGQIKGYRRERGGRGREGEKAQGKKKKKESVFLTFTQYCLQSRRYSRHSR